MGRFFFFCLCLGSLLFQPAAPHAVQAAQGKQAVEAGEFLQALGAAPSSLALYDFFSLYDAEFKLCRQTSSYLKALGFMADNGETGFVRARLVGLAGCPSLGAADAAAMQSLAARMAPPAPLQPATVSADQAKTGETDKSQSAGPVAFATPVETAAQAPPPSASKETPPLKIIPPEARNKPKEQAPAPAQAAAKPDGKSTAPPARTAAKTAPDKPGTSVPDAAARQESTPSAAAGQARPRIPAPPPVVRSALVEKPGLLPARKLLSAIPPPESQSGKKIERPMAAEFSTINYYRDGDRGTSRFYMNAETAGFEVDKLKFSASAVYVTSFDPRTEPETGSSWKARKTEKLLTEDFVLVPKVQYGDGALFLALGLTPVGGTVDPLPTGTIKYSGKNLGVTVFHDGITDSLLAYVGFTDVYSGKEMGRVMKAGGKVEWQDSLSEHWFYGGVFSGAYLYGENVRENTAVKGEAYFGRSFGPFAVGVYASIDHFARDLNHFTYGHGGYYSPYVAAAGVGFVSWEYKTDRLRFKVDTGAGHLYEEIRDSSHYYGGEGQGEDYKGSFSNKFVSNTGFEAALPFSENMDFTANARVITSGQYFETRGGLGLKISF